MEDNLPDISTSKIEEAQIEVDAVWVKIKTCIVNKLTDKIERAFVLHNLSENPIVTFKEVYLKSDCVTKIIFKDGDHIYSPTTIETFERLAEIKSLKMYGNKLLVLQAEEAEKEALNIKKNTEESDAPTI